MVVFQLLQIHNILMAKICYPGLQLTWTGKTELWWFNFWLLLNLLSVGSVTAIKCENFYWEATQIIDRFLDGSLFS